MTTQKAWAIMRDGKLLVEKRSGCQTVPHLWPTRRRAEAIAYKPAKERVVPVVLRW